MNNQAPLAKLVNSLVSAPKGSANSPKKGKKKSKKSRKARGTVNGTRALGSDSQGPLMLKTEQFATYTPMATFTVTSGTTPGGIRVRGRELIQALNSGSSAAGAFGAANTLLAGIIRLVPSAFPRLNAYTSIYEFYKFHKAKLMFQSTRPTTAQGVSMIAVDYDAKDTVPSTTIGMMRNISSSMSNIYADNATVVLGTLSRLPKFATQQDGSSDLAQLYQASILYAFEGLASTEVNTPQGYMVAEYDVEFFTPQ